MKQKEKEKGGTPWNISASLCFKEQNYLKAIAEPALKVKIA